MLPKFLRVENLGEKMISLVEAVGGKKSSSVFYSAQNTRYFIATRLRKFFLYVTNDRLGAREAHRILSDYADGEVVLIPEKDELLLNIAIASQESLAERMAALGKIIGGEVAGAVISAEGLTQYFPDPVTVSEATICIKTGMAISQEEIIEKLVTGGYRREDLVSDNGDFAKRGDIIDIFPTGEDMPIRVEFFGDEIEKIRVFAPETMISVKEVERVTIYPKSDILISQNQAISILKRLQAEKKYTEGRLSEIFDENIFRLETNPNDPALIWALPFFYEHMSNIVDYLPEDSIIILDEPSNIDDKVKLIVNSHYTRVKSFVEEGEATEEHRKSLIPKEKVLEMLKGRTLLSFQNVTSGNTIFEPQYLVNIKAPSIPKYSLNYEMLVEGVKANLEFGTRVMIFAGTKESAAYLKDFFLNNDLKAVVDESFKSDYNLVIYPFFVARGFSFPEAKIIVIGTDDVIRRSETKKKSLKKKRERFIMPEVGDYVVHDVHGIGISEGLLRMETRSGINDYYVIRYKDEDRLYLPVSRMDELERYNGGGKPIIHRLGSRDFEKLKNKVKESIKEMAIDLVGLYKKRLKTKGYKYQPDTYWQKEMEEDFEYTETDDQLLASDEIKRDMESGKIMDRLLCGDVGFGKTEVAIRAIFKTILEGKQAAILSPTTILCQQHYNTISERLKKYNLNIDMLSRFVGPDKTKQVLKDIEAGKTNIVVATHRILSKDVQFKDLGLLVLDEEQRFGVEQKEKIKLMKSNVNVLSLSATPVPRTLHMALSGIRDISTLENAPQNRLPVETYVVEYTDSLVKDAVKREVGRGGQVFILFNRVQGIESFYRRVQELVGEDIAVTYAHGQMGAAELEDRINSFYNQEYQVLVSTTIIENGIDLPSANTLIVIDSDMLGLSALYQLRGRVGRSHNLAYAYFTVREGKVLTTDAGKRLDALTRYTELGSGFKIAMEDLEIRGAGNILGREQHGNMQKVGYDMYCRLLDESVKELQGQQVSTVIQTDIKIDGEIYLPENYILVPERRVIFYKRVSSLTSIQEEKELIKHYEDSDGKVPVPALRLIKVGLIKHLAQALNIKQVTATAYGMGLMFYDNSLFNNPNVFKAMDAFQEEAVLSPSEPPTIIFNNKKQIPDTRIEIILRFLLIANGEDPDTI